MTREYKTIKQMEGKIKHLREQGYSSCETGKELGYIKEQIEKVLRRELPTNIDTIRTNTSM